MKVLIVTKHMLSWGGAAIVNAFIVDALLKLGFEVKVICYSVDELIKFKQYLGVDFDTPYLTIEIVNGRFQDIIQKSGYLNSFYLMRFVKRMKFDDHILFSTWDEMDFGRKAIQYIHWISHHPSSNNGSKPVANSFGDKLRTFYRFLVSTFFAFNKKNVKNNISIFNSRFTKKQFEKLYGETSGEVVHPPLMIDESFREKFSERENGFIYSGRISRDKNIHKMIEFIAKIRDTSSDFHFHIVGPTSDEEYKNGLIQNYPYDWMAFEGNKTREELSEILGKHKYSLQGRYLEPFGMAAAESCKMGCLTFVPSRSGAAELIKYDSLKFDDFRDLPEKFKALQNDPELQCKISGQLVAQFADLTPDGFQKQIQSKFLEIVKLNQLN